MPFRLNNTEITALKFNNVDVEKAYLNGTQVFSSDIGLDIGELYGGGYYIGNNKVCTNRALKDIYGFYDTCVSAISGPINGYSNWYIPSISELKVLYFFKDTFTTLGIWDYLSAYHWANDTEMTDYRSLFHLGDGRESSSYISSHYPAVAFRTLV